jgi:hypothetical protein
MVVAVVVIIKEKASPKTNMLWMMVCFFSSI